MSHQPTAQKDQYGWIWGMFYGFLIFCAACTCCCSGWPTALWDWAMGNPAREYFVHVTQLPKGVRLMRIGKEHRPYKDGYWYEVKLPNHSTRMVHSQTRLPQWFVVAGDVVIEESPPVVP